MGSGSHFTELLVLDGLSPLLSALEVVFDCLNPLGLLQAVHLLNLVDLLDMTLGLQDSLLEILLVLLQGQVLLLEFLLGLRLPLILDLESLLDGLVKLAAHFLGLGHSGIDCLGPEPLSLLLLALQLLLVCLLLCLKIS